MFNQKNFLIVFFIILFSGCAINSDSKKQNLSYSTSKESLNIQTWESENGTRVFYVHAPQLPMVDIRVVFDAGSARDNTKPGLATMTSMLLDHGAGEWSTNQIAERFDNVGAQFSTSALRDMAVVSLRSLTDKEWLDTALSTMTAVLQKPAFDKDEFERERKRLLVGLKNQKESPSALAEIAFYKALYKDHPYATPSTGTEESVSALALDDLQKFYQKYYVAKNSIVVIVGAVDKSQAKAIVGQLTGGLKKGERASALPKVARVEKAHTVKQEHPSKQTHIWAGQEGVIRGDEDYFALYVGNHILGGGGFGSRIVEEIREARGLAYSSYSYFSPMRNKGPFLMGLQTKNEQADEALKVLMETLNKFIDQGPSEAELTASKQNITGGFPLKLDSNKDITEYVAMIGFYDLPMDYLSTFNDNIEKVSIDDIKDAFKRRVHPDAMVTVMVGAQPESK